MKTKSNRILISAIAVTFLSFIISVIQPTSVWADGTETLGPPGIAIGSGSGIVAAGTGLVTQPSTIDINVPGAVVQVLLYWEGQMETDVQGDNTITLDGIEITGTLIGGQTFFFSGAWSSAFRADITSLGLVANGTNSFAVSDCDFTNVCNGAGLMVIYDDGSGTAEIGVRDGIDLAFFKFSTPRDITVPQTFSFAPSISNRSASLHMFFTSVAGSVSGGGPIRPSEIKIEVGGITNSIDNASNSSDGDEWDTFSTPVTIPANASTLTVQAISTASEEPLGASFTWTAAALSVEIEEHGTGRFTGGGHQWLEGGVRITRGLTVHCDLLLSNNLQVNWKGNRFHMTEHLETVSCTDDPNIIQFPPAAPLDTLVGVGTGRYNGEDGYTIEFTLVDAGEPGRDDKARILIYETANPANEPLNIPLQPLVRGNLQAHEDQPHK